MQYSGITLTPGFVISAATDPQFNYVTALLHGDGTNAGTNNTFLDSSPNNLTLTRNGTPTQGTFTPYGTLWSNYFNGSTDYLSAPANAVFAFGTGDFTVEAWINRSGGSGNQPICQSDAVGSSTSNKWWFAVTDTGLFFGTHSSGGFSVTTTTTFSVGTWYHVAVTRASGVMKMFINGVSTAFTTSGTPSGYSLSQNGITIGAMSTPNYWNGYISNLRIISGTALYTVTFTPSTTPLTAITNTSLLTCQSNRFIDNSTNNFTITTSGSPLIQRFSPFGTTTQYDPATFGGTGLFGTADYLQLPTTSAFQFGTNDFTIECWVYLNSAVTTANRQIWYNYPSAFSTDCIFFGGHASYTGRITFWAYNVNASAPVLLDPTALTPYMWTHIAVVRSGTTFTLYRNGVSVNTSTSSASVIGPTYTVGGYIGTGGSTSINGYLGNYRIVNGTAVYTSNFTPPTTPLASITNTAILLSCTNGQIYDNGMMNNFITAGSAQISTSVVKYGTGSIAFNGSTDYLTALNGTPFQFPGDFTVEAWVYSLSATGQANYSGIFDTRATNVSSTTGIVVNLTPSGYLNFYINGNNYTSATLLGANNWTHVALVRSGSTISMYQNGVSVASVSYATSLSSGYFWVGSLAGPAASGYWQGYIDELRISKGFARYTANFTAPTSIFPSTGPIPVPTPNVEYLVVAGGGGGGWSNGGGGGAGGYRTNTGLSVTTGSAITVTIGTGGAGSGSGHGSDGTVSVFGSITSSGGGGGGSAQSQGGPGNTGGSGGGGGNDYPRGTQTSGGTGNSGGYTPAEGTAGGASQGGGGGASTSGSNGATNGVGGAGAYSSITGSSVARGGGGGGSTESATDPVLGGVGGGGNGQKRNSTAPGNGTVNTGGGGGGGANSTGGTGGSGFVAIRYTNDYLAATSTTGSPSITNTGGYWIYAWTSSGSITF